jgi:hypothetical protein
MYKRRGLGLVIALSLVAASLASASATAADTVTGVHRVPLHAWVYGDFKRGPGAGCETMVVLLVSVPPGIDSYQAWVHINGYGEEDFSGPPFTNPIAYGDVSYHVPEGEAGWFVAFGGQATCSSSANKGGGNINGAGAVGFTSRWEVSGQVTVSGSSAAAPGITVEGDCTGGGGTTTTDSQGQYEFLVDKGPCTLTPHLINNLKATPLSRSFDVESNIDHADFVVPCGAVPAKPGVSGGRSAAVVELSSSSSTSGVPTTPPLGACPLDVKVIPLQTVTKSGLSRYDHRLSGTAWNDMVAFEPYASSSGSRVVGNCLSGCTDMLVKVHDPNKPPAPYVDLTVGIKEPLPASSVPTYPPLRSGVLQPKPGRPDNYGFLCRMSDQSDCGSQLSFVMPLKDGNGHGTVVVFSPGVVNEGDITVQAEAEAHSCSAGGCSLRYGENTGTAQMVPHLVFRSALVTLPGDGALMLAEYASEHPNGYTVTWSGIMDKLMTATRWAYIVAHWTGLLDEALEGLENGAAKDYAESLAASHFAAETGERYEVLHEWGSALLGLPTEKDPQDEWTAYFLRLLGLAPEGLADSRLNGAIKLPYTKDLASDFMAAGSGLFWTIGNAIAYQAAQAESSNSSWFSRLFANGGTSSPVKLQLSVYEVSWCSSGGDCAPGYKTSDGTSIRDGIVSDLYLLVTAEGFPIGTGDHDVPGYDAVKRGTIFNPSMVIPYRADIWRAFQPGVMP